MTNDVVINFLFQVAVQQTSSDKPSVHYLFSTKQQRVNELHSEGGQKT